MRITLLVNALKHVQVTYLLIIQLDYVLSSVRKTLISLDITGFVISLVLIQIFLLKIQRDNACHYVQQAVLLIHLIGDAWMFVLGYNMLMIIQAIQKIHVWQNVQMDSLAIIKLKNV